MTQIETTLQMRASPIGYHILILLFILWVSQIESTLSLKLDNVERPNEKLEKQLHNHWEEIRHNQSALKHCDKQIYLELNSVVVNV